MNGFNGGGGVCYEKEKGNRIQRKSYNTIPGTAYVSQCAGPGHVEGGWGGVMSRVS